MTRRTRVSAAVAIVLSIAAPVALAASSTASAHRHASGRQHRWGTHNFDGVSIAPGKIKHVWLIILENKSYDATFTGLNSNTYLWHTLPHQGVLLRQYYGTGHFSQDNYTSLVSGQAPITDLQSDCRYYGADLDCR